MINKPPYTTRTEKELLRFIKDCQNKLQMRDWNIDLIYGDRTPRDFEDNGTESQVSYQYGHLTALVWLAPSRCLKVNVDPCFVLAHELSHCWQDSQDDEVRSNVMAMFLMMEKK